MIGDAMVVAEPDENGGRQAGSPTGTLSGVAGNPHFTGARRERIIPATAGFRPRRWQLWGFWIFWGGMAPAVGFEPTTNGLTVRCATAAPRRKTSPRPEGRVDAGVYHRKPVLQPPLTGNREACPFRGSRAGAVPAGEGGCASRRASAMRPGPPHGRHARLASWRSGYAEDCKSLYGGSIPSEASISIPRGIPWSISRKRAA